MDTKLTARRAMLTRAPAVIACIAAIPLAAANRRAAAAKLDKSDVHYQDSPREGKRCVDCAAYVAMGGTNGVCRVVDGPISPEGWCMAYSQKD